MSYFKNNDINVYANERWEKMSEEKKANYYKQVLTLWHEHLPFYEVEDTHTLTKRHGPFLLSLTFNERNDGYIPSFSIRTLYASVDIGKNSFVKFLQDPTYFNRVDYFNDTFSGMISYFSIEETFTEVIELFQEQVPIAFKKEVTLFDINQWMEYCILGEKPAFLPQYMLSHIHTLKYFEHEELAEIKLNEYFVFIEEHLFELREGYLNAIDEEYQTLTFWLEQAELPTIEIQNRVQEQMAQDDLLGDVSLSSFPNYPIVDFHIPIKSEYISADERYNWALDHMEVKEVIEKETWAQQYLFFDRFEKVEGKPYVRTMYREHLESLLERFIAKEDYFFDLETDGHIAVRRFEDEYEVAFFHRDETNTLIKKEYAIFQHDEYIKMLTSGVDDYLMNYFNLTSEKNKWYALLDDVRNVEMDKVIFYN